MDLSKQTRRFLSIVRRDLLQQIEQKNFLASKQLRDRLRVVANQFFEGELRGVFYMRYLEKGFRTKPKGVSPAFVQNIMDWMMFKNIQPQRDGQIVANTETNIKRSAFGIATGIVRRGTSSTRQERNLDLRKAIDTNMPSYLSDIGAEFLVTFSEDLKIKRT